jgi:diguanylate cyclase (GGDEF)-like protein
MNENQLPPQDRQLELPQPDFDLARASEYAQRALLPVFSDTSAGHYSSDPLSEVEVQNHDHQIIDHLYDRVDDLAQQNVALEHKATHDGLTRLLNKTAFNEQSQSRLEAAPQAAFALFYIDLDKFKTVNDTLGHAAGDMVLESVSDTLLGALRDGPSIKEGKRQPDLITRGDRRDESPLGRLGGDEFAAFVELTDESDQDATLQPEQRLAIVYDRLTTALQQKFAELASENPALAGTGIGASVGTVLRLPGDQITALQMIAEADASMQAKKQQQAPNGNAR